MNLRSSLRLASPVALTLALAFVAPAALTEAGLGALPGAESVSFAQGAPPPNDAVTEIARQRYQEGVKDFDAGKWEEARAAFLQAYALKRSPAILLNLGLSELRAGKYYEDAGNHLQQFLRELPAASPDQRATAEKGIAEVKRHSGILVVVVDANGADVSLDGATVGRSPLLDPVFVKPGKHTVFAVYQGKSSASVVEAKTGATVAATLSLGVTGAPAPAPAVVTPPTPPSIEPPGSGLPPGMMGPGTAPTAPPVVTPPPVAAPGAGAPGAPSAAYPPGGYAPGGYPPGNVGPGGLAPMPVTGPAPGEREPFFDWYKRKPIAWVGTGVAGLGLLGGIIFSAAGGSASGAANTLATAITAERDKTINDAAINPDHRSNVCGDRSTGAGALAHFADTCTKLRDNESLYHTDVALAVTGWVLFGVGVAGTTAYAMIDWYPSKNAPPKAAKATTGPKILAVAPVVSPALQGVTVVGSF